MPLLLRTTLAMLAFAGNSLLCRMALQPGQLDAASFTLIRLASGALLLTWLLRRRDADPGRARVAANPGSALALWAYAAAFSFAYLGLTAATGALILFGSVQVTMSSVGLLRGERVSLQQGLGFVLAASGLIYLLLPGVAAPSASSALLMVLAGAAWGVYSLRGRASADALANTAGNFVWALAPAALLSLVSALGFDTLTFDVSNVQTQHAVWAAIASCFGIGGWLRHLVHRAAAHQRHSRCWCAAVRACAGCVGGRGVSRRKPELAARFGLGGGAGGRGLDHAGTASGLKMGVPCLHPAMTLARNSM